MLKNLRNTLLLSLLLFRRDRFKIFVWMLSLLIITCSAALSYPNVYTSEQDILAFALTMDNPAMVAMIGPGYELADYSTTTIFAHELLLSLAIATAVMNILFTGRSTRADEEEGQFELVRSLPVERHSYLSASLIEVFVVNLTLVILLGIGLYTLGLDGMDLEGCFLFSGILGVTGFSFASVTATFAQLAETSRGTIAFSFGTLIVTYILRAIGDVNAEALSYLSPLGWMVRTKVFVHNTWWPVILSFGLSLVFIAIAYGLHFRRDMGAGFIPARRGNEHASALLQTKIGFVFNQQRLNIIGWAFVLFLLSTSFGSIMGDVENYFSDMEFLNFYLDKDANLSLTEQFLSLTVQILSLFGVIPAVIVMLRLYGEEQQHRMDHFYARAVPRSKMLQTYFCTAMIVTVIMQLSIAFGLWIAGMAIKNEHLSFLKIFSASFAYLPSMWVIVALTVLLVGSIPKVRNLIWGYVVLCFLILYVKDLLNFPSWFNAFSSFEHASDLFNGSISWLNVLLLSCITMILYFIGYIGYQRRDIG